LALVSKEMLLTETLCACSGYSGRLSVHAAIWQECSHSNGQHKVN